MIVAIHKGAQWIPTRSQNHRPVYRKAFSEVDSAWVRSGMEFPMESKNGWWQRWRSSWRNDDASTSSQCARPTHITINQIVYIFIVKSLSFKITWSTLNKFRHYLFLPNTIFQGHRPTSPDHMTKYIFLG